MLAHRLLAFGLGLAAWLAPAPARAAGKRSLTIAVAPAGWRAEALGRALSADLADDQLAPRPAPDCGGPCGDPALRSAGIELVVRATLAPGELDYELRALWPGGPAPVRGALALHGVGRSDVAGALRDQLHRLARATTDEDAAPPPSELPGPAEIAAALAIALGLLATPLVLGLGWTRRPAARRTVLGIAGIAALAIAGAAIEPGNPEGVLLAAGGIAWGAFAAVTLPVVIPPLVGLARIDHRELGRVFAAWGGLVAVRAVLLAALYGPVALAICAAVPGARTAAVWLPLGLLVARQWVRLIVVALAERLDAALADPAADAAGWDAAVRGYLVGYLRRNGLPIDRDLLDRLTIVPAAGEAVRLYGGGATHTRLAIPRKMLEFALAPWGRPHDYAAPRVSTLHWTEWNAGLVMATEPGSAIATREQRQPHPTTEGDPSAHAREPLGEPPTTTGIIEPIALDPRRSYRPHDDPAWLDWDIGEDHDGTDASDRDFLFGALAAAIAQIQRHGDRPATLVLALGHRALTRPIARLLGWWPEIAGDGHTAIQGARHHLVQYLGWLALAREDLLTARAYAPELEAMSRRVMAALDAPTDRLAPAAARARARLARLAPYVAGAVPPRSRWRRPVVACAVLAGATGVALAIADAVHYRAPDPDRPIPTLENPSHGKD